MAEPPGNRSAALARVVGLLGGPLLAIAVYVLLPGESVAGGLSATARATAAVAALMAAWWLTEAIPLSATALVPLAIFPLLGIADMSAAAAPYADKVIYLFLGGFLLGAALQRCGMHRRIALITVLVVGTRPRMMIAGCMGAAAMISMWVSNTATVAMMLPIGLSLVAFARDAREGGGEDASRWAGFATAMVLGIAYASTIGGVGTLIGTPPNTVFKAFVERQYGERVSFVGWMKLGIPIVVVFLPLTWLLLTRVAFRVPGEAVSGGRAVVRRSLRELGPVRREEWVVLAVFTFAVLGWMLRGHVVSLYAGARPAGMDWLHLDRLTDEGIAMIAALLLFVAPVGRRPLRFALDWSATRELPWGTLLLFGGGLSLAAAIQSSGLDAFLGRRFEGLRGAPPWLVVLAVSTAVIFLTELTSNTAVAATLMPVLASAATGMGVRPELLLIPVALAASLAFMLPVGTPPNAMAFGTGQVTVGQMARAGLWLNLMSIIIVVLATLLLSGPALGLTLRASPALP